MDFKTTFKFHSVTGMPAAGGYKVGSLNNGQPTILFSMDFITWTIKDEPKTEWHKALKDAFMQISMHEFGHAMQEFLDIEYDELQVEKIMNEYEPSWAALDENSLEEITEGKVFAIDDMLDWIDSSRAKTADELKSEIKNLFLGHTNWVNAKNRFNDDDSK